MVFNFAVTVRAEQNSSFVFENVKQMKDWIDTYKKNYNGGSLFIKKLDSLAIGDECYVGGEGEDLVKIVDIEKESEFKYFARLSNGKKVNLVNCFKSWKASNLPKELLEEAKSLPFDKVYLQENYIILQDEIN